MKSTSMAGPSFVKTAGLLCLVGAVIAAVGAIASEAERWAAQNEHDEKAG